MKIHHKRVALLVALLMAIGLAALPLEGAAKMLRYIPEPPQPSTAPGDPDVPYGRATKTRGELIWLRADNVSVWLHSSIAPSLVKWGTSAQRGASRLRGSRR